MIAAVVDSGVLLSLGRSRDGGALSIAFVHNGAKGREWYSSPDDFVEGMFELAKYLRVLSAAPTDTPANRGRGKGSTSP